MSPFQPSNDPSFEVRQKHSQKALIEFVKEHRDFLLGLWSE